MCTYCLLGQELWTICSFVMFIIILLLCNGRQIKTFKSYLYFLSRGWSGNLCERSGNMSLKWAEKLAASINCYIDVGGRWRLACTGIQKKLSWKPFIHKPTHLKTSFKKGQVFFYFECSNYVKSNCLLSIPNPNPYPQRPNPLH